MASTVERPNEPGRAAERRPIEHGSFLGRSLHALFEAPLGVKSATDELAVPTWLATALDETRRRWPRTYVTLRGTPFTAGHGYAVQLGEERPGPFLRDLRGLLNGVADEDAGMQLSGRYPRLTDRAAATLDVVPTIPGTAPQD